MFCPCEFTIQRSRSETILVLPTKAAVNTCVCRSAVLNISASAPLVTRIDQKILPNALVSHHHYFSVNFSYKIYFMISGIEEFLFYSISWEIRGLALDGNNDTQVLGPISRVSMASSIDFHAGMLFYKSKLNTFYYAMLTHFLNLVFTSF